MLGTLALGTLALGTIALGACGPAHDARAAGVAGDARRDAAPAGVVARPKPCDLVTAAEAAAVLGHAVTAAQGDADGGARCAYLGPGGTNGAVVSVDWEAGPAGMAAARAGTGTLGGASAERIVGLGDDAIVLAQAMPELSLPNGVPGIAGVHLGGGAAAVWARQGRAVLNVGVTMEPDAKGKATALARTAVARLGRPAR